jgi:mono/diheme cytochrome c family protein
MTATRTSLPRGRTIYLEASCHACHGPNAEGVRDIPRLDGLAYVYLKAWLEQWGIKPEQPYPLIGQFDLDQCAGTRFTIHIP